MRLHPSQSIRFESFYSLAADAIERVKASWPNFASAEVNAGSTSFSLIVNRASIGGGSRIFPTERPSRWQ